MKTKYLLYGFLPVLLGAGLFATNIASAHGWFGGFMGTATPDEIATRQQKMFDTEAQILGISVDDVKTAWASGQTIQELMKVKGITQDQVQTRMKDMRLQQLKTQLQALVDKGIITQAQSDKRLQFMQTKMQNNAGIGRKGFGPRGLFF